MCFIVGIILFAFRRKPSNSESGKISIQENQGFQLIDLSSGQVFSCYNNNYKIGRANSNDLILNARTISKIHAEINYNEDLHQFLIENFSDINPVKINGKNKNKTFLIEGNVIQIAQYKFKFLLK